jgi:hypothetical protein
MVGSDAEAMNFAHCLQFHLSTAAENHVLVSRPPRAVIEQTTELHFAAGKPRLDLLLGTRYQHPWT